MVTALALIGGLVLEQTGTGEAKRETAASSAHDASVSTAPDPSSDKGFSNAGDAGAAAVDAEATKPVDAAPSSSAAETEPEARRDRRDKASPQWEVSFGAEVEVVSGIAPRALGTVPLFAEVSRRSPHQLVSPSIRARFERPGTDAHATTSGSAHFTWTEGSVDICPVAWWPVSTLRLHPCLRSELGIVEASGVDAPVTHHETRPWLNFGGVAASRWEIAGPLFVELEAVLLFPAVRDRFYLDPASATIFQSAYLGFSMAGGAGVSIW